MLVNLFSSLRCFEKKQWECLVNWGMAYSEDRRVPHAVSRRYLLGNETHRKIHMKNDIPLSSIAIIPPSTLRHDSCVSMSCSPAEIFMAHLPRIKLALSMRGKEVAGGMGCG